MEGENQPRNPFAHLIPMDEEGRISALQHQVDDMEEKLFLLNQACIANGIYHDEMVAPELRSHSEFSRGVIGLKQELKEVKSQLAQLEAGQALVLQQFATLRAEVEAQKPQQVPLPDDDEK